MRSTCLFMLLARSAWATASCTPGQLLPAPVGLGGGVASPPVSDAPLRPMSKGFTYILEGNRLIAIDNASPTTTKWTHTFTNSFLNTTTVNPVQLSGSGTEWLFLVADNSLVYKISADGSTVISRDVATVARTNCIKAQSGDLTVMAPPAVQLCLFSNEAYKTGATATPSTCTDADDLVIVPTHFINCPGYNRVMALRASDLALPTSATTNPGWAFGNSGTYIVDPASDGCEVIYDSTTSTPPFNNTVVCGTDLTDPLHNSLWALQTNPATGGFAFPWLGHRTWSVNGGAILGRPTVKSGTSRIYYGTSNGGASGTFRVKALADGSDIYTVPVFNPIAMPVWSEFRPPDPGLTNMSMVVDSHGVFRRFLETGGTTMTEAVPVTARGSGTPMFKTAAAVLPSAGRVYLGQDNGEVRQMDASTCEQPINITNEGYVQFTASDSTFNATLDFNDYATSSDIDRMSVADAAGELRRYCVPFGDGVSFQAMSAGGRPPPAPQPHGCSTPQFAGDCTCDAQCANYAPASPCYTPHCQIRGAATEGVCVLAKAANGSPCDNGSACDCSPAFAGSGSCDTSTCPTDPVKGTPACDVCTDGVCMGTYRSGCACSKIGDLACDTSLGQGCCGNGNCANLSSDVNNCGACGNVCPTGYKCTSGACLRNYGSCKETTAGALNAAATAGKLNGGSAIEYTFDGSSVCYALVPLINGTTSSLLQRVDPSGAVASYAAFDPTGGTRLALNYGGVSSTFDGKLWYLNLFDMDKQSILAVEQDPWASNRFLQSASSGFAAPTQIPFPVQLYDDGFEQRPAIHLKSYNVSPGKPIVFLANLSGQGGTIGVVNPALPGNGQPTCFTTAQNDTCATGGLPIEAMDYMIRNNGDGVLVIARGTTITIMCDDKFTNDGAGCRVNTFSFDLGQLSTYPNTDATNTNYIPPPMDRIYALAIDHVQQTIYAELGTSGAQQDVAIEDRNMTSFRQVVRNVWDVEIEHNLSHGTLKPVYNDFGGRLAVSRNGILTRIAVNRSAPGGVPTFYSGQVQ